MKTVRGLSIWVDLCSISRKAVQDERSLGGTNTNQDMSSSHASNTQIQARLMTP